MAVRSNHNRHHVDYIDLEMTPSVFVKPRANSIFTPISDTRERGSTTLPLIGAGRVCKLLEKSWQVKGILYARVNGRLSVKSRLNQTAFLNTEMALSADVIKSRLLRYGFTISGDQTELLVQVPPYRLWDVEKPADLYEG